MERRSCNIGRRERNLLFGLGGDPYVTLSMAFETGIRQECP